MKKKMIKIGDNIIYLWPDAPYVLAGKVVLEEVINSYYKDISKKEVILSLSKKYSCTNDEVRKYVEYIFNYLERIKIKLVTQDNNSHNLELAMVTFNITKTCNLNCSHCYAHKKENHDVLDIENIAVMIDNISTVVVKDPKLFIISGGEPTITKDKLLFTIIHASKYGFNLRLNTNGYKIDQEIAEVCKKNNVLVQVSLDGVNSETHKLLRVDSDSFCVALDAIKLLVVIGCRTRISMTVHSQNFRQIPDMITLAQSLGVEQVVTSSLVKLGSARYNNIRSVSFENEFEVLFDAVKDSRDKQFMTKSTLLAETINAIRAGLRFEYCGSGMSTCCVDSNGDVYPCINFVDNDFKLCNITEHNFIETWLNSRIYKQFAGLNVDTMNEDCKNCDFRYFCGSYCRAETYFNGCDLKDKYVRCREWKKGLLKVLEILAKHPNLYDIFENKTYGVIHRE